MKGLLFFSLAAAAASLIRTEHHRGHPGYRLRPSKSVVAGAKVTVTGNAQGGTRQTVTDETENYTIAQLPPVTDAGVPSDIDLELRIAGRPARTC